MANSTTPFGFMPYGHAFGGAPTYELEQVNINSSDTGLYFTGDLVYRSTTPTNNVLAIQTAPGSCVPAGVFWGCEFFSAAAGRKVWSRFYPGSVGSNTANGVTTAWVISDPNAQFKAVGSVGDGGAGTTWAITDIGMNATIVTSQSSLGNTTTGQSAMVLSSATTRNASTPFKIIDLLSNRAPPGSPNTDNTTAFNGVVVKANNWERGAGQISPST